MNTNKKNKKNKIKWYNSFFEPALNEQVVGEDSTIYLASARAPRRIKTWIPDVKLIFIIRNTIDRAYSHYWHLVERGGAVHNFEQQIRYVSSIISRGFYKSQLKRFLEMFPRGQIKVILFERFVENTRVVIDEVCSFIGVSESIDLKQVNSHVNASKPPNWLQLYLILNYALLGMRRQNQYDNHLPGDEEVNISESTLSRIAKKLLFRMRDWVPKSRSYPCMFSDTREKLGKIFKMENSGLSEFIDNDISQYWPFMNE